MADDAPARTGHVPGRVEPWRSSLGLLALLALPLLWWPQSGDQALFQTGGRLLADGGIYWRDFWDVKQPGIFWLYAVSERVGAGVLGVRLMEIVAAVAAGAVVLAVVQQWRLTRLATWAAPLLVVGPYVLSAAANGVGQVEGLITLPVLIVYWACGRAALAGSARSAVAWGVGAGVAAFTVAALKLLYLPVVLAVVASALIAGGRGRIAGRGQAAAVAAGLGAFGALLALAATSIASQGIGALAWWSTVVAPGEQLATGLFTSGDAIRALVRLAVAASVTGPLAAVAVVVALRRGHAGRELGLVVWLVASAVLAAPQLPTTYRSLFLLPPLGLLAVLGLDQVVTICRTGRLVRRGMIIATAAVLAVPPAVPVARLTGLLVAGGPSVWSLSDASRLAVGDALGGSPMVSPAGLMRERVRPGTAIYVLGDPVVYRVLSARQGIEMNGWGPEIMSPRMWREIARELDRSRPEWIFVQAEYQADVDTAPDVAAVLRRWYRVVDVPGGGGTWWHTDSPGGPPPTPDGNRLALAADVSLGKADHVGTSYAVNRKVRGD